jgi:uncharacterized protein YacL
VFTHDVRIWRGRLHLRGRRARGSAREGRREAGQAVGYLDDGTMVVVEASRERIGSEMPIVIRNVIATATGRKAFANLR